MHVLAISSAFGGCSACLWAEGVALARAGRSDEHGLAAELPALIERLFEQAATAPYGRRIGGVAVCVGPGSFTGLRAGIAVAVGVGLACQVPVLGVTVAEAFGAASLKLDGRRLWVAVAARRDRVFIDRGDGAEGFATDALPAADGRIAVAGNAATVVAAALAAKGADVMLTDARAPRAEDVAAVGMERFCGQRAPLPPLPIYVDAPEAKLPAAGLRAAPV
jgi:tRNA threonylcarbamoyl adenosine modification protein YeaZ